ncbi:MAG: hypothetical protein CL773_00810 [Chloroflexi bacterium]|nr:hypothetical protein [Chloroflexota bacterium]|tara:strand:+ start:23691 stop:23921 length:231 start_codon:yes stop_codon:yes gene_type:complete
MNSEKEYIFYQFENSYKILKLSLLGDFITKNKNELDKHCEVMLHRIFPEKSREKIKKIIICNEEELLSKISELKTK